MARILFVTQQVDPGHPALAATVPKLRALAARAHEVVVLADRALPDVLPETCRVRSFGARSRLGRGLRFASALAAELARRPKPAAVVAHMCPIYAVLAAPLTRRLDVRLEVYGPALNPAERAHRAELERLVEELDLGRRVKLAHAVLRTEVPGLFARADVLVNNMRAGATDKVVYEACASCLPAIASNPAFDSLLDEELRFEREDARGLADRLLALGRRPPEERHLLGETLRERVAASHSVGSWAD